MSKREWPFPWCARGLKPREGPGSRAASPSRAGIRTRTPSFLKTALRFCREGLARSGHPVLGSAPSGLPERPWANHSVFLGGGCFLTCETFSSGAQVTQLFPGAVLQARVLPPLSALPIQALVSLRGDREK